MSRTAKYNKVNLQSKSVCFTKTQTEVGYFTFITTIAHLNNFGGAKKKENDDENMKKDEDGGDIYLMYYVLIHNLYIIY